MIKSGEEDRRQRNETVVAQPISSAPKPQVSDAISGENLDSERIDTMKSVDDSGEK